MTSTSRASASNRDLLDALVGAGRIRVPGREAIERLPDFPIPIADANRWRGMMLGLAFGDSLGNTSESEMPEDRRASHGEIRNYLPHWQADGRRVGLPSDDTQLAFWTLEQWVDDSRFDPDRLAEMIASRRIHGMGASVRSFIGEYRKGRPWPEASAFSAGNGALMRIAATVVPHMGGVSADLWADAILNSAVTHNDPASISACTAFAGMLADLLAMSRPPDAGWWLRRYVELARPLEGDERYSHRLGRVDFEGRLTELLERYVPAAHAAGKDTVSACDAWRSSAYLLETVPSVIYILTRHAHDPEEAIICAVNDTWDNDTIAAIVGAAVGALHGEAALPRRWRDGLVGRTRDDDDGRVFELLAMAERKLAAAA
jgi:ADP-ribosylglycohydrolase